MHTYFDPTILQSEHIFYIIYHFTKYLKQMLRYIVVLLLSCIVLYKKLHYTCLLLFCNLENIGAMHITYR